MRTVGVSNRRLSAMGRAEMSRATYIHTHTHTHTYTYTYIHTCMQWECQPAVRVLSEELKRRGYTVWIDLEQMRGEMNKRMAEAVEGAAVVCPCITRVSVCMCMCMCMCHE